MWQRTQKNVHVATFIPIGLGCEGLEVEVVFLVRRRAITDGSRGGRRRRRGAVGRGRGAAGGGVAGRVAYVRGGGGGWAKGLSRAEMHGGGDISVFSSFPLTGRLGRLFLLGNPFGVTEGNGRSGERGESVAIIAMACRFPVRGIPPNCMTCRSRRCPGAQIGRAHV